VGCWEEGKHQFAHAIAIGGRKKIDHGDPLGAESFCLIGEKGEKSLTEKKKKKRERNAWQELRGDCHRWSVKKERKKRKREVLRKKTPYAFKAGRERKKANG